MSIEPSLRVGGVEFVEGGSWHVDFSTEESRRENGVYEVGSICDWSDPHIEAALAARVDGRICAGSPEHDRRAFDVLMLGEFGVMIEADKRRRAARELIMLDPTDDRPLLVLLTNQHDAAMNGVYMVVEDGTMVREQPQEKPAPWWRGAVAAASVQV